MCYAFPPVDFLGFGFFVRAILYSAKKVYIKVNKKMTVNHDCISFLFVKVCYAFPPVGFRTTCFVRAMLYSINIIE